MPKATTPATSECPSTSSARLDGSEPRESSSYQAPLSLSSLSLTIPPELLKDFPFQPLGCTTALNLVYVNDSGNGINEVVSRCVKHIVPFVNDGAEIRRIGNSGMNTLKIRMKECGGILDKTLEISMRSLLATRHIERFFAARKLKGVYKDADVVALRSYVVKWCTELLSVQNSMSSVAKDLRNLLEDASRFESKSVTSSTDDETSSDPEALIVKYVEVDISACVAKCYPTGTPPVVFDQLKQAVWNSAGIYTDVVDLSDWWTFLANHLVEIQLEKDTPIYLSRLQRSLARIYHFLAPYVSQVADTVEETKTSSFKYPFSRTIMESAQNSLWKDPHPARGASLPSLNWSELLDTFSFTLIAKPITVNVGGSDLHHIITARITKVVKLRDQCYGVILRIVGAEKRKKRITNRPDDNCESQDVSSDNDEDSDCDDQEDGDDDEASAVEIPSVPIAAKPITKKISKAKYRCTSMEINWSFQQSAGNPSPSIVSIAPISISSHKSEEKHGSQWGLKSPGSILSVGLPVATYQESKAVVVPYSASVKGVHVGVNCTWKVTENPRLKQGVSACDVGVILNLDPTSIAMTTSELSISLEYVTTWKGSWGLKKSRFPKPTRHHSGDVSHTATGSTTIPFRIYSDLNLIKEELNMSTEAFLETCGPLISEMQPEKK